MRQAIEACASEPIHLSEAIQPHGALLALDGDGRIVRVSENAVALLGMAPDSLLGRLAEDIQLALTDAQPAQVENVITHDPRPFRINGRDFRALTHRAGTLEIVELEPAPPVADAPELPVRAALKSLGETDDLDALLERLAMVTRQLTGFDRVMIYRFDDAWNGEVVAESRAAGVESFLGLHYPASDIPAQARALYARSWLRVIEDVDYAPVRLLPAEEPGSSRAMDLSGATLRSVSPVHLQYLRNMGVGASASVSLLEGGRLWGLVACHHRTALRLPFASRVSIELVGQMASMRLGLARDRVRLAAREASEPRVLEILDRVASGEDPLEALSGGAPSLLSLVEASGGLVVYDGRVRTLGRALPGPTLTALRAFLSARFQAGDELVVVRSLVQAIPGWEEPSTAGLLAIALTGSGEDWVVWLRPPMEDEVRWGGAPLKSVDPATGKLTPRNSFAEWRERMRHHAAPFTDVEQQLAERFRRLLVDHLLRQSRQLARTTRDLARRNVEVDSFAYVVSHDLREPLRGITTYASFLLEDLDEAAPEVRQNVERIQSLTARMDRQLRGLLDFSRAGRGPVARTETDLGELAEEVCLLHAAGADEAGLRLVVEDLPRVQCDPVAVQEIFANLIANAIKYAAEGSRVTVGHRPPGSAVPRAPELHPEAPVIFVADDGPGLEARHFEAIFDVFTRLSTDTEGTGCGLPIARAFAERHGGALWVDSTPGHGATFYFTLGRPEAE
ncbi:MAG: ATP-binding protein [Myxococcota bacterium]